jgi:phage shock protein A
MALINRFTRLLKADLHTVIEQFEEPMMLLKQSLREMEEVIQQEQQQLKQYQQQQGQTDAHIVRLKTVISESSGKLETCFNANNEELARVLIRRKLEAEQQLSRLKERQVNIAQMAEEVQQRINQQQPKLEAMQQELALLNLERPHSPTAAESGENGFQTAISDADVEVALLHEKAKRSAS